MNRGLLAAELLKHDVLHADETPVAMLKPGNHWRLPRAVAKFSDLAPAFSDTAYSQCSAGFSS